MQIYNNNSWKLSQVKEIWFNLEKDMQSLTEVNLENIFWLEFIKTEFQLNNLRIDSLAFDNETNSFVIIEYKRWNSYSVIDQWMSYLALMLNNKADFTQELWRKRKEFIDVKDIDWSQSRVIIIADSFNRYQRESINFKDLAIELWELKQFSNWVVVFNPIKASNTTESIKTVTKFETWEFKEVNKEIVTYDEDYHKKWVNDEINEAYDEIKTFMISLNNNIEIDYKKVYIAFKLNNKNIIDISLWKWIIKIWINAKKWEIKDLYWITEDVSNKWHHWNWDYEIKVSNVKKLAEIKDLIRNFYNNIYWNDLDLVVWNTYEYIGESTDNFIKWKKYKLVEVYWWDTVFKWEKEKNSIPFFDKEFYLYWKI